MVSAQLTVQRPSISYEPVNCHIGGIYSVINLSQILYPESLLSLEYFVHQLFDSYQKFSFLIMQ